MVRYPVRIHASLLEIPSPLLSQLAAAGRLIGPVGLPNQVQELVMMVNEGAGQWRRVVVEQVAYIPLGGNTVILLENILK